MAAVAPQPAAAASSSVAPTTTDRKSEEQEAKASPSKAETKQDTVTATSDEKKTEDKPEDKARDDPSSEGDSDDRKAPAESAGTRFDLEPNPFEQSFSRGSQSQERTTPPRGGDATSVKHNALPPLSSLTSPAAADPSQFPWLAGHSLRQGPLSPAMLAGPAQNSNQTAAAGSNNTNAWGASEENGAGDENFEPGNFRTGFTPGAGTGFTPGYNALLNSNFGNLPIPSPNTAAFLNSITNANENVEPNAGAAGAPAANPAFSNPENRQPLSNIPHMQQPHGMSHLNPAHSSQETITPNTLNALTGAMGNDMNRPPPAAGMAPGFYPQGMPGAPPGAPGMAPGMPHVDYVQQSANAASQAANGLFLLSQAHQELSKREEEAKSTPPPMSGKRVPPGPPAGANTKGQSAGQKRKESGSAPKAGSAKKGKKASPPVKEDSVDSDDDMDDKKSTGRPETEEEKRKNFLERNRQAALKCRQRKKAWLNELQNKVETLSMDNERLQQTVHTLDEEIARLSAILMQHRDCGLAMPNMAPAYGRPLR